MLVVQTHLGTGPPEGEIKLFLTSSFSSSGSRSSFSSSAFRRLSFRFSLGSSRSVMDCKNLLFSIKRNCEVRSSWNYSSQKIWVVSKSTHE